ncbi:DUF349 domain-containing protein [Wenzhouxiangella limi]|uniref:DUF349 domain-containing protein n=1 Tax=Wenzhouxiangella limi TaxID=2707351 RepID=A0A845VDV2_9GAMM|nr:DUF349 domain-containing protein [Wenzhouxiangella limi]NDY95439.1 DUF349 domain-containing protein [Wenzhouxiangella limi]
MNLRSKFLKKPWQQKDPEARAAAVRQHQDPELKAELAQIAQHDDDAKVRLAALERIDTEPFWLDARLRESDPDILQAADRFLARSILKSDEPTLESARLEWFERVEDAALVRKTAASAPSLALRRAALARIDAQGFLGDRYASEPDDTLADEILPRLQQTSTLERVIAALRGRNKRRARAAVEALEGILSASGQIQAGQAASERLVHEAEQLARGNFSGEAAKISEDLRQRWLAISDHPEGLAHRFESALRIAEAARQRSAGTPEEPDDNPATPAPEPEVPDSALAAAADHIRTGIRRGREIEPARMLADWDRAWNALGAPTTADEQLKQDMLPLLRELQAQIQQRVARQASETDAKSAANGARETPDFEPRLERVAASLEAGEIGRAHEQIRSLRRDFDRLPPRQRPGPAGGRLQRMEGRLKEMRDWQHWSNNKLRDELIVQVESLPGSGQHPDAITAALKKARSEWKRLEALEILPGDKRRFAAPSGQWRRFQSACKQAFEAARPFFEKREQVQKDNLETLHAFIDAGQAAAASADSSPADLLGFMRKARQAIRRMDDLPPKSRGASAASLRALMDQLSKRLDELFDTVEANKRRLVAEARALAHEKDLKTAVEKAKSLQQQWQRAGAGRRRVEQQLWRKFREPIDPLFEKLKGEQTERRQADQQALAELEALCVQAEELARAPDEELAAAASRFNGLLQQWLHQDGRPQRLNQRFEQAERQLAQRREAQRTQAQARERDRLWSLAAAVQDLWRQRCEGEHGDLSGRIPAVAPGDDATSAALQARASAIARPDFDADHLRTLAGQGLESARQVAVEMEFLSGLDTPEADQQLRMDYQVKRLARRMSERERQPDLATEMAGLQSRWLQSLPHPPGDHAELLRRFQRAREVIEGMVGLG